MNNDEVLYKNCRKLAIDALNDPNNTFVIEKRSRGIINMSMALANGYVFESSASIFSIASEYGTSPDAIKKYFIKQKIPTLTEYIIFTAYDRACLEGIIKGKNT